MRLLFVLLALVAWPREAAACSYDASRPFSLDPSKKGDTTPPGEVIVGQVWVKRGAAPQGQALDTCAELGKIEMAVTPPRDDRTPSDRMGYRVALVGGQVPMGLTLPADPILVTESTGHLTLVWIDGETDQQEPCSFDVDVSAVDLAGNASEKPTRVHVEGPAPAMASQPSTTGTPSPMPAQGCHAARGGLPWGWGLLSLLLARRLPSEQRRRDLAGGHRRPGDARHEP